jgi:hypothetical protein
VRIPELEVGLARWREITQAATPSLASPAIASRRRCEASGQRSQLPFRRGCLPGALRAGPGRFRFDESQRSSPVRALTESGDQIWDAAALCLVEAILLTDADTGKPVPLDD